MEITTRKVDHSALKVNQAFIIAFLVLGFVLNSVWLVGFVAAVMLLGTAVPALSLFKGIYSRLLRPAGLVKPNVITDNPEPHRFAQGFGGVVLLGAIAALLAGAATLGWALVGLVIVLAALNLFLGFCAGCFVYYQLSKLGVPGFDRRPIGQGGRAMLERLTLVLVLAAAGVAAYALLRQLHMRRMQSTAAGRPALLYFRSDTCAVCPAQGRYVDDLAAQWSDVTIERIDATRDPETAARYRVFSLPTTVLIDGRGQVRHVNYGLTDAHKLGRQLAQLVDSEENDPQIGQIGQIFGRSN